MADINATNPEMLGHNKNVWKGFALTDFGLVTQRDSYFKKGKEIFDIAINEITADSSSPDENGYLPLEITRGKKAHSYHIYTLQPMLGIINLSKAINCNFLDTFDEEDRLTFLIRKLVQGRLDPSIFHRKTGQVQSSLNAIEGLFSLLGGDAQSKRILDNTASYLVARNLKFDRGSISSKVSELGGDVSLFPAPRSIPRSNKFRQFCDELSMSDFESSRSDICFSSSTCSTSGPGVHTASISRPDAEASCNINISNNPTAKISCCFDNLIYKTSNETTTGRSDISFGTSSCETSGRGIPPLP
ncbi:MAG: alginate lyase family protein [Bdellovibrionales bacterium]|nr:alginate lyase family protein [Bdellovibrionales bacterium]